MMQKLMQNFRIKSKSILLPLLSKNYCSGPSKSLISWLAAYSTSAENKVVSRKPNNKNSVLAHYLASSFKFSKDRALSVSSKYSRHKTLEKPEQVVHFFKGLGFSDAHIRAIVHGAPQILFAYIEKTLKPKIKFFQELGLSGPLLGLFISRNPIIMFCSLDRCLKPRIGLIRKILASDGRNRSNENVNDQVCRTITRCGRIVYSNKKFEANIRYLESCGVVGSQLSSLLSRLPRFLDVQPEKLAEIVSRALDMNFTLGSRMLVHGIHSLSCMSIETLNGKFEVFKGFGFSKEEVDSMFRKSPYVFALSAANLRHKLEVLLNNLKVDRLAVVQSPVVLTYNIEERVTPRYKVLEILKLKGLLKKDPSLSRTISMAESQFLESYILPFASDAEELLLAYKGKSQNFNSVE